MTFWATTTEEEIPFNTKIRYSTEKRLVDDSLKCDESTRGCDITFRAEVTENNAGDPITGVFPAEVRLKGSQLGFCTSTRTADVNVSIQEFNRTTKGFKTNISITGKDVYELCPSAITSISTFTNDGDLISIRECDSLIDSKDENWREDENYGEYLYRFTIGVNNTWRTVDGGVINATVHLKEPYLQMPFNTITIPHNVTDCSNDLIVTRSGEENALPLNVTHQVFEENVWGVDACVRADLVFYDSTVAYNFHDVRYYDVYFVKPPAMPMPANKYGMAKMAGWFPVFEWDAVDDTTKTANTRGAPKNTVVNSATDSIVLDLGTCP
jgi:hypothetical protein